MRPLLRMAVLMTMLGPQTLTLHSQASMRQFQRTMVVDLHRHSLPCSQVCPALLCTLSVAFPVCYWETESFTFITLICTFNVSLDTQVIGLSTDINTCSYKRAKCKQTLHDSTQHTFWQLSGSDKPCIGSQWYVASMLKHYYMMRFTTKQPLIRYVCVASSAFGQHRNYCVRGDKPSVTPSSHQFGSETLSLLLVSAAVLW